MTKKMFALAFAAMLLLLMGCNPGTSDNGNSGTTNGNGNGESGNQLSRIVGTWMLNATQGYEFTSDGKLIQLIEGDSIEMGEITACTSNTISIRWTRGPSEGQSATWEYELNGTSLKITVSGVYQTYTKR